MSKQKKEDNEVVYKAYCLVAENKNQHWFQDLSIKEAMFIIENYDLKVEVNLSGQFLSSKTDKLSSEEYAVPLRIAATKEALKNDISVDWCICGSEIEELDLGNVVRWWPRKWLFGKKQTLPEHIRIDYGIVSKKHLILDLEVVTDVSKSMIEKSFGDIVTEAEIGELRRIELSKSNLKTENRVNKDALVVEESVTPTEIQNDEVGDNEMKFFRNKKREQEQEQIEEMEKRITDAVKGDFELSSEPEPVVENTIADVALDDASVSVESAPIVHKFPQQSDDKVKDSLKRAEEVLSQADKIIEEINEINQPKEINEVHTEENMNNQTTTSTTTEPVQQGTPVSTASARKRLATKRIIMGTGIVLAAATIVTAGIVCWKKFHK